MAYFNWASPTSNANKVIFHPSNIAVEKIDLENKVPFKVKQNTKVSSFSRIRTL